MQTFIITFQAVAVLFFIGFVGFLLLKKKFLPQNILGPLSSLVLEVSLPSLIFVKLIKNFDPYQSGDKILLPLYWAIFSIVLFILAYLTSHISKKESKKEFFISLFFQNAMFIPIILISELYGDNSKHLVNLFLFTVFFPALFFNTYSLFYSKKNQKIDWKKVFHPVFIALTLAVIIKVINVHTFIPDFLIGGLGFIGNMAIPLLTIVLGGIVYIDFQEKGKIDILEILKFIFVKNIIFPAVALIFIWYVQIPKDISLLIVILSAVPPLTALPIVMDRVGGNRPLVNQLLVSSMFFCLLSIPLTMSIYDFIIRAKY